MYKILLIEDDADIRKMITNYFKIKSSDIALIDTASNGQEGLEKAYEQRYDLLFLDVMLPEVDGFEICKEVRRYSDIPIMFITARTGQEDILKGYALGCDDYIVKPFSSVELLMRVKAILRRRVARPSENEVEQGNRLALGDVYLDLDSQVVIKGGESIALTYTEFKILELLLTNRKRIFSLDMIYQSIWNENAVGDGAIMVHIKNIRKKLGDDSRNPSYIKTAWGRGYYVD